MNKIVFATKNKHKLKEVKEILSDYEVLSLSDINFNDEVDEPGETTEENAELKAVAIYEYCKKNHLDYSVFADDTGLFVESLDGAPGVHSARFSGDHNDEANRQKLLHCLDGIGNRNAYFQCSICFIHEDKVYFFKGKTYGTITTEKIGNDTFGYDCLFYSNDLEKTFGEATDDEKNSVSHRGRAVKELALWLKNNTK